MLFQILVTTTFWHAGSDGSRTCSVHTVVVTLPTQATAEAAYEKLSRDSTLKEVRREALRLY